MVSSNDPLNSNTVAPQTVKTVNNTLPEKPLGEAGRGQQVYKIASQG